MTPVQVSIQLLPLQVTVIVTSLADGTCSNEVWLPIFPSEKFSSTKEATISNNRRIIDSMVPRYDQNRAINRPC